MGYALLSCTFISPGHPVSSITCREGLTTLPGTGQSVHLRQHAFKQIGKRPPEKPRRRCRPIRGPTIEVMQHRPHLVATQGQAAMVMLHLREITVSTFNRHATRARWNALACSAAHAFQPASTSGVSFRVHGCRSNASSTAWSTSAIWAFCSRQRVRRRCSCQD